LQLTNTSYHIVSYHIISYHTIIYHIIYIILYHTIITYIIIIPYHTILYHIISYHIISYHIISYHIISSRTPATGPYKIQNIMYRSLLLSQRVASTDTVKNGKAAEFIFVNVNNIDGIKAGVQTSRAPGSPYN
jgi:hypothetical protein